MDYPTKITWFAKISSNMFQIFLRNRKAWSKYFEDQIFACMLFCHDFWKMLSFRLPKVFGWSIAKWWNNFLMNAIYSYFKQKKVPPLNFHGNLDMFTQQKSPAFCPPQEASSRRFLLRIARHPAFFDPSPARGTPTACHPKLRSTWPARGRSGFGFWRVKVNGTWNGNAFVVGTRNWWCQWCAKHPQQTLWILWMPLDFLEKYDKVHRWPFHINIYVFVPSAINYNGSTVPISGRIHDTLPPIMEVESGRKLS